MSQCSEPPRSKLVLAAAGQRQATAQTIAAHRSSSAPRPSPHTRQVPVSLSYLLTCSECVLQLPMQVGNRGPWHAAALLLHSSKPTFPCDTLANLARQLLGHCDTPAAARMAKSVWTLVGPLLKVVPRRPYCVRNPGVSRLQHKYGISCQLLPTHRPRTLSAFCSSRALLSYHAPRLIFVTKSRRRSSFPCAAEPENSEMAASSEAEEIATRFRGGMHHHVSPRTLYVTSPECLRNDPLQHLHPVRPMVTFRVL